MAGECVEQTLDGTIYSITHQPVSYKALKRLIKRQGQKYAV
jgi:hypothetical protein